jgi:hypothetical protein
VSAVELLLDPQPRAEPARSFVEGMIQSVKDSGLPEDQKASLRGSLNWMLNESIGQAAKRLAATLDDRLYMGEPAPTFLTRCYTMRSALVHGGTMPAWDEVNLRGGELERMVGDLIGVSILDEFDPGPHKTWVGDLANIPQQGVSVTFPPRSELPN